MENKIKTYRFDKTYEKELKIWNYFNKWNCNNQNKQDLYKILENPKKYFIVANYNKNPAGYIILDIEYKNIDYIFVEENFRKKEIAKELMIYALSVASKNEIEFLSYNYNTENIIAEKVLYNYCYTKNIKDNRCLCNILVGESIGR